MSNLQIDFFESILFQSTGKHHFVHSYKPLSGGCIDQVVKLQAANANFLLKWKDKISDQFHLESAGLCLLQEAGAIHIPKVIRADNWQGRSYLLMEYIEKGATAPDFWKRFGGNLAELHQAQPATGKFGLDTDNYIGSLHQSNQWNKDWISFFIEQRLEKQLTLALQNQVVDHRFVERFRKIYDQLPGILTDEPPSLLHGDLWSGNYLVNEVGYAALIDPAVYYGNREIEIAFTKLFGGFDKEFYQSYQETWPLAPCFEERVDIYNLYPLLVHVNLFGSSYLSGIESTLRRFI